jgi:glyoxylase-like metal-dependent hydrolase (beta-lactamase superfamily II)
MPRTLISVILLAFTALAVRAQEPANAKIAFHKVADGVYAALPKEGSGLSANSGFVIGTNAVWVFDALRPDGVREILAEIRKHTSAPVRYVINSHHHYELVMGNGLFPDAAVVAHTNVRRNLIAHPPKAQIERTRTSAARLGLKDTTENAPDVALRLPDLTYSDELVFHDGDRELRLIHLGRYHTDADSVLYLPKEKVLFSGDLLPGIGGPGGQRDAYFREFVQSIDKALALDLDTIIPGRGEQLATKKELRAFRDYLAQVIADVQGFVDRGATLEETQAKIRPPAYIDPNRLNTPSFKRLWADGVARAYNELKAAKSEHVH